jgi:lysophospholipase L1-like esterase
MSFLMSGIPRIQLDPAKTNIVCVGNSLTHGDGGDGVTGDYPHQMSALPALNGISAINAGVSGARTIDMIGQQATNVDAHWDATKATNVLIIWEGTNSIADGASAATAYAQMITYIANILAVHKWVIVLMTCLPRENSAGQTQTDAWNASLDSYNALLVANYRSMGAKGLVNIRAAGSPYNTPSYNMATFEAFATASGLFVPGEIAGHNITHQVNAGYAVIASMVAAVLPKLPRR